MTNIADIKKSLGEIGADLDDATAAAAFWLQYRDQSLSPGSSSRKAHNLPLGRFADKIGLDSESFKNAISMIEKRGVELTSRSQATDAEPSYGSRVEGNVRSAFQGPTFGLGDEVTSGVAAGISSLKDNKDLSEEYDRIKKQESIKLKDFERDYPIDAMVSDIAASAIVPGAVAKLPASAGKIKRALLASATGGTSAAISEVGRGEGTIQERVSEANPMAPVIGLLMGGSMQTIGDFAASGFGKFFKNKAMKEAAKDAPDIAKLRELADQSYEAARKEGLVITPDAYFDFVEKIITNLRNKGIDPDLTPKASILVSKMEKIIGEELGFEDLEKIRRKAGIVAGDRTNPGQAGMAIDVQNAIDEFITGLKPKDLISGNVEKLPGLIKSARGFWSRMRKSQQIQEAMERASLASSGFENGIRNEFRSILKNRKKASGFSSAEKSVMKEIVQGTAVGNLFRKIGRMIGSGRGAQTQGLGTSIAVAGGATLLGAPGAFLGMGAGKAAEIISESSTAQKAQLFQQIVQNGTLNEFTEKFGETFMRALTDAARSSVKSAAPIMAPEKLPPILQDFSNLLPQ